MKKNYLNTAVALFMLLEISCQKNVDKLNSKSIADELTPILIPLKYLNL